MLAVVVVALVVAHSKGERLSLALTSISTLTCALACCAPLNTSALRARRLSVKESTANRSAELCRRRCCCCPCLFYKTVAERVKLSNCFRFVCVRVSQSGGERECCHRCLCELKLLHSSKRLGERTNKRSGEIGREGELDERTNSNVSATSELFAASSFIRRMFFK